MTKFIDEITHILEKRINNEGTKLSTRLEKDKEKKLGFFDRKPGKYDNEKVNILENIANAIKDYLLSKKHQSNANDSQPLIKLTKALKDNRTTLENLYVPDRQPSGETYKIANDLVELAEKELTKKKLTAKLKTPQDDIEASTSRSESSFSSKRK